MQFASAPVGNNAGKRFVPFFFKMVFAKQLTYIILYGVRKAKKKRQRDFLLYFKR
jgi:hypothetical protein